MASEARLTDYPFKPTSEGGRRRTCTDVLCVLLFGAVMAAGIAVMITALAEGDYRKVMNGIDFRGCVCGTQSEYTNGTCSIVKSGGTKLGSRSVFVEFVNNNGSVLSHRPVIVCANACPSGEGAWYYCATGFFSQSLAAVEAEVGAENVARLCGLTYAARSFGGYCLPTPGSADQTFVDEVRNSRAGQTMSAAFSSVNRARWVVLGAALLSVLVAFVYLKIVQACAKPLAFLSIALIIVGFAVSGWMLLSSVRDDDTDTTRNMKRWTGIALLVVAGALLLLFAFMFKRILLAVRCVQLASRCVADVPTLVFTPLVLVPLVLGITALWMLTAVYLFSVGEIKTDTSYSSLPVGVVRTVELNDSIRHALWFQLFVFFWSTQFVVALGELVIAGAAGRWYFSEMVNGRRAITRPLADSFVTSLRYHVGTVAFGSLLIAIIKFVRAVLNAVAERAKRASGNNRFIRVVHGCVRCCLWCVEKCLRFINRIAYIMTALYGTNFCTSGKMAFFLIQRNILRIGALQYVSTLFLLLGKLFVTATTCAISYIILTRVPYFADSEKHPDTAVENPFVPCLIIALITFVVASLFMSVYEMVIDTVLQCYIADEEISQSKGTSAMFTDSDMCSTVDGAKQQAESSGLYANPDVHPQ